MGLVVMIVAGAMVLLLLRFSCWWLWFNKLNRRHRQFGSTHAFINEARNSTLLKDENEACTACHTAAAVKINWTHARSLEFAIGLGDPATTPNGPHNWTVTNWDCNETAKATVWGNTTGYGATDYDSIEWLGNVDNVYS